MKNARKKRNKPTDELAILDGFTNPTKLIDKKHIEAIVAYAEKL